MQGRIGELEVVLHLCIHQKIKVKIPHRHVFGHCIKRGIILKVR